MTKPAIAHPRYEELGVAHMLTRTCTIQQDTGSLTPPAGAPNWTAVHSGVPCAVKTMVTEESRESRGQQFTIAADAIEVIAEGWLSDVTTAMRLVLDAANYDILAVMRVGDLELTRLFVQKRAV